MRNARLLLVMLWTAAFAASQAPPLATVKVQNLSTYDRADVKTVVLPFGDGDGYQGEPLVLLDGPHAGTALQVNAFGATYPDGDWRMARVHMPVTLAARETAFRSIGLGTGKRPGFRWTKAAIASLTRFLAVDNNGKGSGLQIGDSFKAFGPWKTIEAGHLHNKFESIVRVPGTPFYCHMVIEVGDNIDHVKFWMRYGDSDPTDPEVIHNPGPIRLVVQGFAVKLRHELDKVLDKQTLTDPDIGYPDITKLLLDRGRLQWCDGESQAVKGVLLAIGGDDATARAEIQAPVLACALGWDRGAFGPWGFLPPLPPGATPKSILARAVADYLAHKTGDPWAPCVLGCQPEPGGTGDQLDFSSQVLVAEAHGHLERLLAVDRSVLREACRPTHRRTADGEALRFSADPNILLWMGRPDFRITRNKLGKKREISLWDTHLGAGINWWGRDLEHWSANYVTYYAMLTGDSFAIDECEHLAEIWLAEVRVKSGSALDAMGASRAVGRTLQAGANLYLVTGRVDLVDRMRDRLTVVQKGWRGRNTAPHRPAVARNPDGRNLGGLFSFTMEWQDALGGIGLDACYQVTGDVRADTLAALWGTNLITHGILQDKGRWRSTKNAEWRNGQFDAWQDFANFGGAGPGDQAEEGFLDMVSDAMEAQWPHQPRLTLDELGASDGVGLLSEMLADAAVADGEAPPGVGGNWVEFYDGYMLWMVGHVIVVQRNAQAAGDMATVQKCAQIIAQVGNGWREWEWKAIP